MTKDIIKAKLNAGGLIVSYMEHNPKEDSSDKVNRECPQIVHNDLIYAFDALKAHVVCICEFPEAQYVDVDNLDSIGETLDKIIISGFTIGGSDETAGAVIIAQRMLNGGKVLNVTTPFIQFESEDYKFASELSLAIEGCEYEVKQYLDEGKYGIIQPEFAFDETPSDADIAEAENTGTSVNDVMTQKKQKQKKSRKSKDKQPETVEQF